MAAPGALFLLAIIFAIARTGSPIRCEVSHSIRTFSKRSTSLKTCGPEYDACGLLVMEVTRSGKTVRTVKKTCAKRESCVPGDIFMHLKNGLKETGKSICCTTDACNAVIPAVPVWNEAPNGFRCPSCSTTRSNPCPEETIHCKGVEDQCFLRATGNIIHAGCATKSFCASSARTMVTITDSLGVVLSSQSIICKPANKG
ncbi:phospholipase A2 inhibitor and Ly6/PLAUR domain-containing protein-like [Paroedura picta]|uniref:phospholipase A2 inhibitor and Ly6/PLAUR domain-containing protein-like n=1 Tax=Paroedura picta TaxID=143630 RepID=UPI0040561D05